MFRLPKTLSRYLVAASICSIVALGSCSTPDFVASFSRSDLPTPVVGDWWRYRITDSAAQTIDTLRLSVISQSVSHGIQTATCVIQRGALTIDTGYFTVSDTSYDFHSASGGQVSMTLSGYWLRVPFVIGSSWQPAGALGPTTVTGFQVPYTVLGIGYDAFTLSYSYTIPDNSLNENFAVMKGIGLVDLGYDYGDLTGLHRRSQQIIDYHIQ